MAQVLLYPGYTYLGSAPDIALVRVKQPFDFTAPEVGCIRLPRKAVTDGEKCYVTGWGATEGNP